MPKTRILIADDHALMRSGLHAMLASQPDMEVAGEAADGAEVIGVCQRTSPEVVLMDLTMPGRSGIEAIRDLKQVCPNTKVLVVTMHEDAAYARLALLEGAAGYVLKKSMSTELLAAIRAVRQGQRHIAPSLVSAVNEDSVSAPGSSSHNNVQRDLTPREQDVLIQLALGYTSVEVGESLHISLNTVLTHRKHISYKLGLRSRADLVRFALEYGLIRQPASAEGASLMPQS